MRPASTEEYDVVIVGSGGGALAAANRAHDRGLSVVVIEKTNRCGGTTALAGAGIWIPNNDDIRDRDSAEQAMTYLRACTEGQVPDVKLRAYVDNSVKAVAYLRDKVGIRLRSFRTYPDYVNRLPGSSDGGRTMFPDFFDRNTLGPLFDTVRTEGIYVYFGRYTLPTQTAVAMMLRRPGWWLKLLAQVGRYWLDIPQRLRSKQDRLVSNGVALIAGLRKGLADRGVPVLLETPLVDLVTVNGRVCGVLARNNGRELTIRARKAVILGSGGFEQNQELRDRYMPKPTDRNWSLTPPGANTGDALQAAIRIGAATEFLDLGWWAPTTTITIPGTDNEMPISVMMERGLPGSITVNQLGLRYANESMSYNDAGYAMLADNERTGGRSLPSWMIFDARFRRKFPAGALLPSVLMPDHKLPPEWLDKVYFRAGTLAELAGKIGIPAQALEQTVHRFNGFARSGIDEDFGRGSSKYDHFLSDVRSRPNPNMQPLERGPFYAIPVNLGDLGTKGGIRTNEFAQALREDGSPILGLYAIGNVSGALTAKSYPGAGATIGPAITFGYVAAGHVADMTLAMDSAGVAPELEFSSEGSM